VTDAAAARRPVGMEQAGTARLDEPWCTLTDAIPTVVENLWNVNEQPADTC
jgi:hypothetical protein